ncbi:MAG: hypothetical protein GX144_00320 [Clostridiaceae bacterium]|nr:hypothetical protein [Clostridiaceae bacterium]
MNTLIVIVILFVLIWCLVYTVSYGIWTLKENKTGGVALFVLAFLSVAAPLFLLWYRK